MKLPLAWMLALILPNAWAGIAPVPSQATELSVHAPPALLQKLVIEPVAEAHFTETLRLPGRVALDEHRVARIGPSISGRVTEIKAFIGQSVQKGDVLALINSTELGAAQAAYLKAKTQVGLQRLAVQRARRLFEEGIISQATLHEREGALAEAEVELRAGDGQLEVMGMSSAAIRRLAETGHIDSMTPVTATLTGTVLERQISVGQIAQPADDLFTVADLSQVWVVAEAPEQDAHRVELGRYAEVEIPALLQQRITGRLIYVADTVNPITRTVTVRMAVENAQHRIKPEMLANMVIRRSSEPGLVIPAQAVVRVDDRDHVFVQTGGDHFELRPVALGVEQDGRRRVVEGLSYGQRIVVDGAFHLNNERIRKELE
ncbi:membrane fusion protein, cobalt-zinc-cadmium efflux system [Methylomagnum ishizawai]|uniref:Membrane fusion protein, cobalt-zinc-cadmium efflux system n=1 Tax=Methylomagnum ishizawai TaxID=1760988 RepID=A0A1Y6D3M2_9GAMM|nr:efflux RND transporter periplasmic adaptor subunit [Methylomagnum ishizawai]SMF97020.1 membrane fusion protein, cobalt-zinc-cadmium efflux system [Methylomagnum ishizawai]